jgi:hypothetical protein
VLLGRWIGFTKGYDFTIPPGVGSVSNPLTGMCRRGCRILAHNNNQLRGNFQVTEADSMRQPSDGRASALSRTSIAVLFDRFHARLLILGMPPRQSRRCRRRRKTLCSA